MSKLFITKEFHFEAAHHLVGYEGACHRVHGHSYKMQVTVFSEKSFNEDSCIARDCMVVDFSKLKNFVNEKIISKVDHSDLNEMYFNPTAEIMVIDFYKKLESIKDTFPGVFLYSVKLWETESCFVEYKGQ